MRWIITVLALLIGGWLAFDGAHGLRTGDYVTPSTGRHAGRLGPWSHLVEAVGLEPRSTMMMVLHVVIGAAVVLAALAFAGRCRGSRTALLVASAATLWYLPFGTVIGAMIVVLLVARRRQLAPRRR